MEKPIVFTRHAEKRVLERFADFGLDNAKRVLRTAKRHETPNGKVYYVSKLYTFVCRETEKKIKVITFYKHD